MAEGPEAAFGGTGVRRALRRGRLAGHARGTVCVDGTAGAAMGCGTLGGGDGMRKGGS